MEKTHLRVGREESRIGEERVRAPSGWWRDICELYAGGEGVGLESEFVKKVRKGDRTLFWLDKWIGGSPLFESFNRLYRLSLQQACKISEMGSWEEREWK